MAIQIVTDQIKNLQITNDKVANSSIQPGKLKLDEVFAFSALPTAAADPTNANQLVRKNYVDAKISGLTWKEPCRVRASSNIDISSAPAAIDGITLANGDRVLLTSQTAAGAEGIYSFAGSGQAMARTSDADTWEELQDGSATLVREGTSAGEGWQQQAKLSNNFNNQSWILFSATGGGRSANASQGIDLTGNVFSAKIDASMMEFNGSGQISVKDASIGNDQLSNGINPSKLSAMNVTLTSGSGLTGGGSINLGGSATLAVQAGSTSTIAVSASGVDIATDSISKDYLKANSVEANQIKDGVVSLAKMSNLSAGRFILGSATNRPAAIELAGAVSVTNAGVVSLTSNCVGAAQISAGAVGSNELASDQVTISPTGGGLSGGGAVALGGTISMSVNLQGSTLTSAGGLKVASDGITKEELATDSVEADAIKAGAVGSAELGQGSVTGTKIADDAVSLDKLNVSYYQEFFNGTTSLTYDLGRALKQDFINATYVFRNGLLCKITGNSPQDASEVFIEYNAGTGSVGKLTFGGSVNGDVIIVRYCV